MYLQDLSELSKKRTNQRKKEKVCRERKNKVKKLRIKITNVFI